MTMIQRKRLRNESEFGKREWVGDPSFGNFILKGVGNEN